MKRRDFLKTAFIFTGALWIPKLGILRSPLVPAQGIPFPGGGVVKASPSGGATNWTTNAYCLGAWYLNGDSSDETDRSANGHTLTDSATSPARVDVTTLSHPLSYTGWCRRFVPASTTNLFVTDASAGNLDINGANAKVTLACWVKISAIADGSSICMMGKYDSANNFRQYQLLAYSQDTANKFNFWFIVSANGTAAVVIQPGVADLLDINTWYHVCGVSDDANLNLYVNGESVATAVAHTAGIFNGSANFAIGSRYAGGSVDGVVDGWVDEVIVLGSNDGAGGALTQANVQEMYNNGISGNKGGSD